MNHMAAYKFDIGDKVKVTSLESKTYGRQGTILSFRAHNSKFEVRLDSTQFDSPTTLLYSPYSLEKVEEEYTENESKSQQVTLERNDTTMPEGYSEFVMCDGYHSVFVRDLRNTDKLFTVVYASPEDTNRAIYTGAIVDPAEDLESEYIVPFKGKITIEQ